jgi:acyl-CoA thioester hydrolase
MTEVWRGGVAPWECDSLGHLNVGFYAAKAMEALVGLAAELGMPDAFAAHAGATLVLREQHIRFLREARDGYRLHIQAGVLEMGECDARLLLLMRHADGELAASFTLAVEHATAREGRRFPWPARIRERAESLMVQAPAKALPRSVTLGRLESDASLDRALQLGLRRIGLGAVPASDCDPFGRVRADRLIARLSDSASQLFGDGIRSAGEAGDVGAAILEYRFLYLAWPKAGSRIETRSAFTAVEPRLLRIGHWMLDPDSGRPWVEVQVVGAPFDVKARKLTALPEAALAPWRALTAPALAQS